MADSVAAQSALERLEAQIRQELKQLDDAAKKEAGGPSEEASQNSDQPAAPQVGQQPAAGASGSRAAHQVYLGIVADDRNDRGRGVRVLKVLPDGPGAKAGLREQDLITGLAGMRIRQMSEMADVLELYSAGDLLAVEILREEKPQKVALTLGQRPATSAAPPQARQELLVPPPGAGPAIPPPPEVKPLHSDRARIELLERRVEQLEQRVEALERALLEQLKQQPK